MLSDFAAILFICAVGVLALDFVAGFLVRKK